MTDHDDYMQALILAELVKHHPAKLTQNEVERTLNAGSTLENSEPDTVLMALTDLERDGLARNIGGEYGLTRPAARLAELPDAM